MDRALLVGINAYLDTPLRGCVNDIEDMANYLVSACGFRTADIRLLADARATAPAIRERLLWLTDGLRAGDRALFHFSGHGAQVAARGPTGELIGLNEVVCAYNFDWTDATLIKDKEFHQIFSRVPDGVELVWVSDSCCASGLDQCVEEGGPRIKQLAPPRDLAWRSRAAKDSGHSPPDPPENFALVAACAADQITSDITVNGRPNGAFTRTLLATLRDLPGAPLRAVVAAVGERLRIADYTQQPQLRGSPAVAARAFLARAEK